MKKLIIIAMIMLLPYVSFAGMAEDEWSGQDKTLHLGVSALISGVVTTFYLKHDVIWWKSALVGVGAATLVGLVKECMDSPRIAKITSPPSCNNQPDFSLLDKPL